jgi:serine/threonine protein kinase
MSDFGLAKWLPKQWTHHTVTPIEGTFGYLAPEYFIHGIVDEKKNVFAFGFFLLELITGRQPIDSSQQSLVIWAKPFIDSRNIRGLADPCINDKYNVHEMRCVIFTISLCVQQSTHLLPCMGHVLQLLTSLSGVRIPKKC